jgi:DNA-binding NarL/FixJ family response regulator
MRHQIAEQLRDAGFFLGRAEEAGTLVVLIAPRAESERGRVIRDLLESDPAASVLAVMPANAANASLRRALIAGAGGIVMDADVRHALVPTARAMLAGQMAVPGALGHVIAPRPLSHREKQILSLVVLGLTNREIAHRLYLAESTVKTHLSSAFRKIDARSRSEAVARIQDPDSGYGPGILAVLDGVTAPAA